MGKKVLTDVAPIGELEMKAQPKHANWLECDVTAHPANPGRE